MDGIIANLPAICDLADRYDALVMVDDSHAVGFLGPARPRHARVSRRDGPRSTSSPARWARPWAAAAAATPAAGREIVELLRQRSRPYLFSNSLPPPIVAASLKALELLDRARPSCATGWSRTRAGSARR